MKKLLLLLTGIISITAMAQWYDFIGQLQFDPNAPNPAQTEATMFYDNTAKAVAYFTDITGVKINVGQQHAVRVVNNTGSSIPVGSVVYISGTDGVSTPEIALANANYYNTSTVVGLTMSAIADTANGYILTKGVLSNIDTSAFTNGDAVHISNTVAGGLVLQAPKYPSIPVKIGTVILSNAATGKLLLAPERITKREFTSRNWLGQAGDAQFSIDASELTIGNSVLFDGGGTAVSGVAVNTSASVQLDGTKAWSYLQFGSNLNDWIALPVINVPETIQNSALKAAYRFKYMYDGNHGDIETRVKCVTSGDLLIDSSNDSAKLWADRYEAVGTFTIPKDCTQILIGLQVVAENIGKVISFDEFQVNEQVDSRVNLVDFQEGSIVNGSSIGTSSNVVQALTKVEGSGIFTYLAGVYTFHKQAKVDAFVAFRTGNSLPTVYVNGVQRSAARASTSGNSAPFTGILNANDTLYFRNSTGSASSGTVDTGVTATATSEKVSHATDTSDVDIVVEGRGCTLCAVTADVTPINFTEVVDTHNAWDGTMFTAPEDGIYRVNGKTDGTSSNTYYIYAYIDIGGGFTIDAALSTTSVSGAAKNFNYTFVAKKGWKLQFRNTNTMTHDNDTVFHWMYITKQKSNAGYVVVADSEQNTKSYTPTFTGFGTISNAKATYRKVGDNIEVSATIDTGTVQASLASMTLPFTIKGSSLTRETTTAQSSPVIGFYNSSPTGKNFEGSVLASSATSTNVVYFGQIGENTANGVLPANGDFVAASASVFSIKFTIPVNELDGSGLVTGKFAKVRTCYLSDIKPNNTDGGNFSSGVWVTRDLNTTQNDCGFLSLNGVSQFTIEKGKGEISCSAPAFATDRHKVRLWDVTNSSTLKVGTSSRNSASLDVDTRSFVTYGYNINTSTQFSLMHWGATTKAGNGFGIATNSGESELYSECKITQILAR